MEAVLTRSTDWEPGSSGAVETKELTLKYAGGQGTVWPGDHIALVLEIRPKKDMRIYAPQVQVYTRLTWELNQSDLYRGAPAEFPEAEVLYMEVIKEKVPVHRGSFRVLQDVEIAQRQFLETGLGAIDKRPELVIEGTLKYQACDNKTCYLPKTMKLKFAFTVEGHEWALTSSP
jgi:hypothetical protein